MNHFTFILSHYYCNYCKAARAPQSGFVVFQRKQNQTLTFHKFCVFVSLSMCSEPTDAPTDLRVSKVDINKTYIHWKPVDPNSVRGEFKEYRVRLAAFCNENRLQSWFKNTADSMLFFSSSSCLNFWQFLLLLFPHPPALLIH